MKLLQKGSDGGKDSGVTGYFLVEIKPLFSIVLLHFRNGTREAFHEHAFNALTLWLKGQVIEHILNAETQEETTREFSAGHIKYTSRQRFHKVESVGETWALSVRGPWTNTWREFKLGKFITLTHGRKVSAISEKG